METVDQIGAQRALEALRNGVPNRDAVRKLGCMQPVALDAFKERLDRLKDWGPGDDPPFAEGMLIAGGFGTGKSHTLAAFAEDALAQGFVVSKVVISKETPLHDLAKLYVAAVREARLPEGRGALLHELALRLNGGETEGWAGAFREWAMRDQPVGMIAASVAVHARWQAQDSELHDKLVDFWSGERLGVKDIRDALKSIGMAKAYDVRVVPVAELAPVRFEFAARLIRAAGFKGWVLLLDEVELIGRYSLLQRAKGYATLARLMGAVPGDLMKGLVCVAAVTDDFALHVLEERRDREKIPAKMKARVDAKSHDLAAMASAGMDLLQTKPITLNPPNDDTLQTSYARVRAIYKDAYGGVGANGFGAEREAHRAMRSYVRRWISNWDLERLYPTSRRQAEEVSVKIDYTEDAELAAESPEPEEGPTESA